eukprot:COSAG02_NODE_178_length_31091_cov_59.242482_9_plen_152_part_00
MIKSCRARREGAPPSSIAFPYLFVQALGNITRQHFRQLRSVSGDLSCIYPEGLVFVHSDGTRVAHETIDADQCVRHLDMMHTNLCADVEALRKHALTIARRKPGDRGAVLPPRKGLTTASATGAPWCDHCSRDHARPRLHAHQHDPRRPPG